jgi:alpha-amylase/alpha-mannosidase (GH57 family)
MPGHIYLCFLWHMHQPFYKDLATGEYKLPWTRMHALKDYYGMVKVLEEFPAVHQTFNLVPSMLVQIDEYARGEAADPFLRLALKPAEELSGRETNLILQYFFQANEERLIGRYPRYAELLRSRDRMQSNPHLTSAKFDVPMLRDLQVLSQLAWFDEEHLQNDGEVAALAAKGRDFLATDQALLGRKQQEALRKVIPVYREFAARGQIELSATPFYHPILPLLCDSNIAGISHPYVPLPSRFAYPGDAKEQLVRSRDFFEEKFGAPSIGLWPSEGSVSDQVLDMASELGFRWIATDNGVLARTLNQAATPALTYQPYLWEQNGRQIHVLFRDHYLSDLIGFVYSRMNAHAAAEHFLNEIRTNSRPIIDEGRDALVPIILDGENAWEYYQESGRPFLRHLYGLISDDRQMSAVTVTEALKTMPPTKLTGIFPGSWIQANFDVWIGHEEDNKAWEFLLAARQTYDRVMASPRADRLSDEAKRTAWEEILIAEGSDWCWWYGPEHGSANRPEFDQLFRDHVANVYRLLGEPVPTELSRPILSTVSFGLHEPPTGVIKATIDGAISSYFEWLGAGLYRLDQRSGAMHSQRSLIQELRYGSDGRNVYLRVDFSEPVARQPDLEFRLQFRNAASERFYAQHRWRSGALALEETNLPEAGVSAALGTIYETAISMSELHVRYGDSVWVSIAVFRNGLPVAALPITGELEVETREPSAWAF